MIACLLLVPGNHVGAPPQVYANDLNPRSYHWLVNNIALNKVRRYLHNLAITQPACVMATSYSLAIPPPQTQRSMSPAQEHFVSVLPAITFCPPGE